MSPDIAWPEACDLLPTPFSSHGAESGRGPSSGVLEWPPWGLLEQDFKALEKMMPLALGSTEAVFSSWICFSSCSVPGALPASLLDSKAQEHFSHLYALVFFCKVPSILNSTSQHSSHLPPSYATLPAHGNPVLSPNGFKNHNQSPIPQLSGYFWNHPGLTLLSPECLIM